MKSAGVKIKVAHLVACLNIGGVDRLINNRQLVNEYGDNAFEYINTNLSIESAAKKYELLYRD
ncbi:MAG: hypothetical protein RPR97_17125 [Colwellia sp.]